MNDFNNKCQVRKGIFIVRTCGEFAKVHCAICNKLACSEHLHQTEKGAICSECYAEEKTKKVLDKNGNLRHSASKNSIDVNDWYYGIRNRFYEKSHYRPYYFSMVDYETFNPTTTDALGQNDPFDNNNDVDIFDS